MTKKEQVIEQHPIFHDWELKGDFVHREYRGRIVEVRRIETCTACPTERVTRIDVRTWELIGKKWYRYVRGVTIERVSKPDFLRKTFAETTDLPADVRVRLELT